MNGIDTLCVELTARCALRCAHCSANATPERREMLEAGKLMQALSDAGELAEVYLSGGEPFEHPALERIVVAARRAARSVVLYSSGVWMGPNGNEPLPRERVLAVAALVSRVDLSLYAARADEHDAITKTPGSFVHTVETARRLREHGVAVGVHHVPVDSTARVVEVATLAAELGASRLHVLAVASQGRARSLRQTDPSAALLDELSVLQGRAWPFEVVLSSALRRALGETEPTRRDRYRAAFLDVYGFLHPGEGHLISLRGRSSLAERGIRDLYRELSASA